MIPGVDTVWSILMSLAVVVGGGFVRQVFKRQDKLEDKVDKVDRHLAETREEMKAGYVSRRDIQDRFDKFDEKLDSNAAAAAEVRMEVAKLSALLGRHINE